MKLEERLWVAADYDPRKEGDIAGVLEKVHELAKALQGTGVTLKVNSILRAWGYGLIREIHAFGLDVCADLKLTDISNTSELDAVMLAMFRPRYMTMMCASSLAAIEKVKKAVGASTQVIGVTLLTDISPAECSDLYDMTSLEMAIRFAKHAKKTGCLDGLVASALEVPRLRILLDDLSGLTLTTPGIRPAWAPVQNDDQKRVATIAEAIQSGADRVVLGRPITQAKDPREAVERTLKEIEAALAAIAQKA